MFSTLIVLLILTIVWTVMGIGVLSPVLGFAWIIQRLTSLTFPEAGVIAFTYVFVLTYLIRTYFSGSKGGWQVGVFLFSMSGLSALMLESAILHRWLGWSMFHTTLLVGGANLLTAYLFAYSITGTIPSFLRDTVVDSWIEDVEIER
jgi:hypothetical protein